MAKFGVSLCDEGSGALPGLNWGIWEIKMQDLRSEFEIRQLRCFRIEECCL